MGRIRLSDVGAVVDVLALGLFSRDSMKACFAAGRERNLASYGKMGSMASAYSGTYAEDCDCDDTCLADDCPCDTSQE